MGRQPLRCIDLSGRVTLEDEVKFRGSIDMDMNAEKCERAAELRKTFSTNASTPLTLPSTSPTSTNEPDEKDINNKISSDPDNY